ncbi:MAG: hypothetical protein JWM33_1778 [Caulobacteraceae bacterium]|nr:hypothetical protein [Caulobacteraceae bacterium]
MPNRSDGDAWAWWRGLRPRFNRMLALAGVMAYLTAIAQSFALGRPLWFSVVEAAGMTVFLGAAYAILIGLADIALMLGPFIEVAARPANVRTYRRIAWRMAVWGGVATPFLFPLTCLVLEVGRHGA